MSYSAKVGAVLLSVALSACAHGAYTQQATSGSGSTVQSGGERHTDGPTMSRTRSAFLASQGTASAPVGGPVVAEYQNCSPWAKDPAYRCNIETIAHRSLTPGFTDW